MKTRFIISSAIILISQFGCKKDDMCANEEHIFNISEETKQWLPIDILTPQLKFQSENGEMMIFHKDTVYHREHVWSFSNPCGDGQKKESIFYERISHVYRSGDTAHISMSTNIVPTECGWGNVNEVKLMEEVQVHVHKSGQTPTQWGDIGSLSVRTKLINAEETEEFCNKHYAKFNSEIEINGVNYQEVYSDDRPGHENTQFPLAEIYFQRGQGIVGFVDENGKQWRRIE